MNEKYEVVSQSKPDQCCKGYKILPLWWNSISSQQLCYGNGVNNFFINDVNYNLLHFTNLDTFSINTWYATRFYSRLCRVWNFFMCLFLNLIQTSAVLSLLLSILYLMGMLCETYVYFLYTDWKTTCKCWNYLNSNFSSTQPSPKYSLSDWSWWVCFLIKSKLQHCSVLKNVTFHNPLE